MIDTLSLRIKINEAAIHGLLTTQFESEDDISELLEQIDAKKRELQESKAIKKTKQLPPVSTEETPFDIPANWKWVRFGNVISLKSGQDLSKSDFNPDGDGLPYLTGASNVDYGGKLIINRWTTRPKSIAHSGDLLLTCKGTVGKLAVLDITAVHIARQFMAITAIGFDVEYARIFMEATIAHLRARQKGLIPGIERKDVLDLCLPMPPLAEQQRIVERVRQLQEQLDTIDAAQERYSADLGELNAKINEAGVTGELTAGWRNTYGKSTDDWTELTIGTCFDVVGGIQKKPDRAPKNNPIPYVTVANVFRNRIDLSDLRYFELFDGELERLQLKDKDILVVEGNGSGGEIGRCAMWENQIPVCVHQNHIIRLRCIDDQVFPEYVLLFLNSPTGKAVVRERAKTTTGLYNLSAGKIRSIPVPLPSLEEQKRIVERVGELLQALPE